MRQKYIPRIRLELLSRRGVDITDILLTADAPAIAVFAAYLWNETRRLQKSNESLRQQLATLHGEYVSYVKAQATRWREMATAVSSIRKSYDARSDASDDA